MGGNLLELKLPMSALISISLLVSLSAAKAARLVYNSELNLFTFKIRSLITFITNYINLFNYFQFEIYSIRSYITFI